MELKHSASPQAAETANEDSQGMFQDQIRELIQLQRQGELPQDFDMEAACRDREFALLLIEYPVKAAVRVYAAENGAKNAQRSAREKVTNEVRSRNALPQSIRTGLNAAPERDYRNMSSEEFRTLEQQFKKAFRSGKRLSL